jgi:hypothetical protein
MFENNVDNFIDKSLQILKTYFDDDLNKYLNDPLKRLENKTEYIRFLKEKISYKIDKQEGRTFSGAATIKGSSITFVGSLSGDLSSGAIATKQGTTSFKIVDPNKIALCFTTTTIDPANKNAGPVADCHEISRK